MESRSLRMFIEHGFSILARVTLAVWLFATHAAQAGEFEGSVVRVVDGDSLIVQYGHKNVRVRLKEIDAPEIRQAYGKQSRQSLINICESRTARVNWSEKDRNGRTLARVWCSGIDANAQQVARGMAWVFDRYVKDRSLYRFQDRAKLARLGLWAEPNPSPPWEWRKTNQRMEYRR
jgi:endonuclease YncB( thermonuclease family)